MRPTTSPKITDQDLHLQYEVFFLLPFPYLLFLSVNAQEDNVPSLWQLLLNLLLRSLASLAKVVLDNRNALDYFLAEQGEVYAIAYVSCCTWINTSGTVVQKLTRKYKKVQEINTQAT